MVIITRITLFLLLIISGFIKVEAQFFQSELLFQGHGEIDASAVVDINQDGLLDVVAVRKLSFLLDYHFGGTYYYQAYEEHGIIKYRSERFSSLYFDKIWQSDLDRDGDTDLLVRYAQYMVTDTSFMMILNHDGQLSVSNSAPEFLKSLNATILDVADMNGDSIEDIYYASNGKRFIAELTSEGTFIHHEVADENTKGTFIMMKDVNDDQIPDVVLKDIPSKDLWLLVSDSAFHYRPLLIDSAAAQSDKIIGLAEFSSPGFFEFVKFDQSSKELQLLRLGALNTYPEIIVLLDSVEFSGFFTSDFNADGYEDIYWWSYARMLLNNGSGQFNEIHTGIDHVTLSNKFHHVIDPVQQTSSTYFLYYSIYIISYDQGVYDISVLPLPDVQTTNKIDFSFKDINGDSLPDLAIATSSGVGYLPALPGKKFGTLQHLVLDEAYVGDFDLMDFNRDDIMDVGFTLVHPGAYEVRFGDSLGNFGSGIRLINNNNLTIFSEAGDFEADGYPDILTSSRGDSILYYIRNHGGVFVAPETLMTDIVTDVKEVKDLDNDGDLDVWLNNGFAGKTALLNNGSGDFNPVSMSLPWAEGVFKDFDKDGIDEFVHYYYDISIYKLNGSAYSLWKSFPVSNRIPEFCAFIDYNLDGYIDLMKSDIVEDSIVLFANSHNNEFVYDGAFHDKFEIPLHESLDLGHGNLFTSINLDSDGDEDLLYTSGGSLYWLARTGGLQTISGNAYWDLDLDTIRDTNDPAIEGLKVKAENEHAYSPVTYTGKSGYFSISVDTGNFHLILESASSCWESLIELPIPVSMSEGEVENVEIPYTLSGKQDEVLAAFSHGFERCFTQNLYSFKLINTGCKVLKGKVIIQLDPRIENFNSEILTTHNVQGNRIEIPLDSVLPGESPAFRIRIQVPGSLSQNLLHHQFSFEYDLQDGTVTDLLYNQNYETQVRCSFDPNDKIAIPDRSTIFDKAYVEPENLFYTIRFQNTGNDTAFTVKLVDTLSENLDLNTIRMIDASHPYTVALDENARVLTVLFENILLPDSTTNLPASNGFFTFMIRPSEQLADYTSLFNTAAIYFDFNEAVITDTNELVYVSDLSILETSVSQPLSGALLCYPNPTSGKVYFDQPIESDQIRILDGLGRYVPFKLMHNGVDLSGLPKGIYTILFENGTSISYSRIFMGKF